MKKMIRTPLILLLLVSIVGLTLSGSAYANQADNKAAGITVGEAVSMIVKGLGLNIDHIRFFKEPKASDYYTKVEDDAAYAGDFIVAQFNGLGLPKDVNPKAKVTREQFAKWLYGALSHKGEYAWIEIYINVADENLVSDGYMDSIQKLLIAKIATLDSKQRFHPKKNVTRGEASVMIERTVKFIREATPATDPEPAVLSDPTLKSESAAEGVLKVALTATAPHPGYGIEITGIRFADGKAVIQYRAVLPDPDKMYPQMLKDITATTYVSADYEPVVGEQESPAPYPGK
jgi:hypothetical protein